MTLPRRSRVEPTDPLTEPAPDAISLLDRVIDGLKNSVSHPDPLPSIVSQLDKLGVSYSFTQFSGGRSLNISFDQLRVAEAKVLKDWQQENEKRRAGGWGI